MMPNLDGFELAKMLRESEFNLPILMITAKGSFNDKSQGFASGADDYMVKPIDTGEMLLRVSALLRRARIVNERKLTVGETVLKYDYLTVNDGEKEITLPQKEFNILYKLLAEPGHIFTRQQLMDEFWGMDSETDARTVDVHINRLREKLGNNKDFSIITVRGLGYKATKNNP
jgi:DNA-binding response OmpR family regulator